MQPLTRGARIDGKPFDLLDTSEAFKENPFPTYRTLRDSTPVFQNSDGTYVVTRYDDVAKVLTSPNTTTDKSREYRKVMGEGAILEFHLNAMTTWDPPRHTKIRRALQKAFLPPALARWEPLVHEAVEELLAEAPDGRMNLVYDFAAALPLTLICKMLGVPTTDRRTFRDWATSITSVLEPAVAPGVVEKADRDAEDWRTYFGDLIARRRKEPGDDLVSLLLTVDADEGQYTDLQLLHNIALLLSAGHETTTSLITNGVDLLLSNPGEAARLRAEPALIDTAVEEFLRIESPVQMGARKTTAPIEVTGCTIPEGVLVWTLQGSANRDERQFADPDRLDIGRKPNRHMAFAAGIHLCLGAPLARLEARIALKRLICDFPDLHLTGRPERFMRARYRAFTDYPIALQ